MSSKSQKIYGLLDQIREGTVEPGTEFFLYIYGGNKWRAGVPTYKILQTGEEPVIKRIVEIPIEGTSIVKPEIEVYVKEIKGFKDIEEELLENGCKEYQKSLVEYKQAGIE